VLAPLPLSFTWGCQQVVSCCASKTAKQNKRTKLNIAAEKQGMGTSQGSSPQQIHNGVICQMRYLHWVSHTWMKLASVCGVISERFKAWKSRATLLQKAHMASFICLIFILPKEVFPSNPCSSVQKIIINSNPINP